MKNLNRPIDNLLEFIKSNPNWNVLLSKSPYNLKIKEDPENPDFYMFSYDMIRTQWGDENFLTRCCRGIVLKINWPDIKVISYAFDKFFNMNETYAWKPDFSNDILTVQSKVDGSLVKHSIWEGKELWYTNNGFTSTKLNNPLIENKCQTWQELIDKCLKGRELKLEEYTLMFELCSPINRVVIKHDDYDLIFLGARHNTTFEEISPGLFEEVYSKFKIPEMFYNHTQPGFDISAIGFQNFANSIKDNEGFVISKWVENTEGQILKSSLIQRVKVKSIYYLQQHRLKDANGNITYEVLYEAVRANTIDDIIGAFQEYKSHCIDMINKVKNLDKFIHNILGEMAVFYLSVNRDKKQYALEVMNRFKDFSTVLFLIPKYPNKNMSQIKDEYLKNIGYEKFQQLYTAMEKYND